MAEEKYEQQTLDLINRPRHLIKFENRMNDDDNTFQIVGQLQAVESDIFMAMVAQFWEKQSDILVFSASELKDLVNYRRTISQRGFTEIIQNTFDKLQGIFTKYDQEDADGNIHTVRQNLFQVSDVNLSTGEVKVQISPAFKFLFNDFKRTTQFTRFSLLQYIKIQSKYTKNLFRLLKEYRVYGKREFTPEELKSKLNIKKSYTLSKINERIIKRIYIDLSPDFEQIHVTKKYGRNHTLKKYIFTWRAEPRRSIDIYKDQSISDTTAMYYINTNAYMTEEQKDEATDRYFHLKRGTTKKKRLEKQSYFNAPIARNDQASEITKGLNKWSAGQLKFMISIYQKLDGEDLLRQADKVNYRLMLEEREKRNKEVKPTEEAKNKHIVGELDLTGIRSTSHYGKKDSKESSKVETYLQADAAKNLLKLEEYSITELQEIFGRYSKLMIEKPNPDVSVLSDMVKLSTAITQKKKEMEE